MSKMRNVHLCGGAAAYMRKTRPLEPGDKVLITGDHPFGCAPTTAVEDASWKVEEALSNLELTGWRSWI